MATTSTPEEAIPLAERRKKAEKSARAAEKDRADLLKAAVEEAVKSSKYGHLSAVAREAGITSQYLRDLVEEAHPGWLAKAAAEREAAKAPKGKSAKASKGRSAKAA